MENILHGTWEDYENDSVSLLMAKQTEKQDNTTSPELYVIAQISYRKKQHMYFSWYSFLFPFFPYCFMLLFPAINSRDLDSRFVGAEIYKYVCFGSFFLFLLNKWLILSPCLLHKFMKQIFLNCNTFDQVVVL